MADGVSVVIEQDTITPAFSRLAGELQAALTKLAGETAHTLARDMRARLARQTHGTGRTADAVTVERGVDGSYRVTSGDMGSRAANLPIWLEFGTKHMTARPYFYGAIALEQGTYLRRVEAVTQETIDGLGGG